MINEALVDLDDHVILTSPHYEKARFEAFEVIAKEIKEYMFSLQFMMDLQHEEDAKLVKIYKYDTFDRFPTSLVNTYKELCKLLSIKFNPQICEYIFSIGKKPFNIDCYNGKGLMPGIKETLDFLKEKKCKLKVYTKGNEDYQRKKFRYFKLAEWFEEKEMIIVPEKHPKDIVKNVSNLEGAVFTTDSVDDVKVGIKAGIRVIHVPLPLHYRTSHNNKGDVPESSLYTRYDNIAELINNYHSF